MLQGLAAALDPPTALENEEQKLVLQYNEDMSDQGGLGGTKNTGPSTAEAERRPPSECQSAVTQLINSYSYSTGASHDYVMTAAVLQLQSHQLQPLLLSVR